MSDVDGIASAADECPLVVPPYLIPLVFVKARFFVAGTIRTSLFVLMFPTFANCGLVC